MHTSWLHAHSHELMEVQADAHLHARSLTPEAERKPMKAGLYHVRHTIARRDGSSVRARLQLYRTHAYILATHNTSHNSTVRPRVLYTPTSYCTQLQGCAHAGVCVQCSCTTVSTMVAFHDKSGSSCCNLPTSRFHVLISQGTPSYSTRITIPSERKSLEQQQALHQGCVCSSSEAVGSSAHA